MRPNVLIIDDHTELLFGLSMLLDSVGFTVETAETAEAGLELMHNDSYDAIVVDYRLPGMSGKQFIEHVRHQPRWSEIPLIALTASVMSLEECRIAGATYGLSKPCRFDDLLQTLNTVCEHQATA